MYKYIFLLLFVPISAFSSEDFYNDLQIRQSVGVEGKIENINSLVVEKIEKIEIENKNEFEKLISTLSGSGVGYVLGSNVGKGSGQEVGAILGSFLGGYVGKKLVEKKTIYKVRYRSISNDDVYTVLKDKIKGISVGDIVDDI